MGETHLLDIHHDEAIHLRILLLYTKHQYFSPLLISRYNQLLAQTYRKTGNSSTTSWRLDDRLWECVMCAMLGGRDALS